ncbi:8-oxo-dGTP diphosphatase [Bacillus oleivorans]|uniref:8-oxo-dGTP diphosphatase n=1 Tax=Bacillus oleivorans TaxID=1448271 RepID=A0A285CJ73_9BACI|nr:NUDIX domain-containing protein [Bacillus oleivorans]SNX67033.1 8-oxo-dGTP diphosphatase [Bacillus oleivorans]
MIRENKILVVVKGVIVNEGKVLLVKRAEEEEVGGGTWECASGKIEFGEDLETALVREVQEETGLRVTVERILYATTFHPNPTKQVVMLSYLCSSNSKIVTLSKEHTDSRWCSKDEMNLLLTPKIIKEFENHDVFALDQLI